MGGGTEVTEAAEVLAVLDALGRVGCRVWVSGGWGVDVLCGRQTRAHRDLDLAIDQTGLAAALAALERLGYLVETDWLPVRVEVHRPGRGRVDLHPIAFDEHGDGVQAGFDGEIFRYPKHDLVSGTVPGSADGRVVGCLSAQLQLSFRQGYPLREVDHHDLALLTALPASDQPGGDVNLWPGERK